MPVQTIEITDSPPRPARDAQDVEMKRDTGSPRFALQSPPSDLPMPTGDTIATLLKEQDIAGMSEAKAKHMLSMALRQMRGQQEALSQAMHDLEAMQRISTKRERDAEARLDAETRSMEQNAIALSKKWKEVSEKDREIRDARMQLERYIKERSEKRNEEHGIVLPRPLPMREGLGLVHSSSMPLQAAEAAMAGTDSLDNLALLASQVLTREPLVISKKSYANNASSDSIIGAEYIPRTEKKRIAPEERDQGLQLRPVKRVDLNGLDGEDQKAVEGKGSKGEFSSSATSNGATASPKTISNGRGNNTEAFGKKPQQRLSQQQHLQSQSYSSRSSAGGSFQQSGSGSSSSTSRSGISGAKEVPGRTTSKYRRT
ncbi:hypothetical protein BGZ58_003989 [Dissophora ornata]|nr:hypothetical protein BGZ58_003989 [Dissophora ornata]